MAGEGGGTVRMGRCEAEDMGGEYRWVVLEGLVVEEFDGRLGGEVAEEEERETVFLVMILFSGSEAGTVFGVLSADEDLDLEVLGGRPETRGGGSSRPSTALRES